MKTSALADNIVPVGDSTNLEFQELFDYAKSKVRIKGIIGSWSNAIQEAARRRRERYVDIDVEKLRQNGDIQEDETFIPDRLIDTNIMREIPDAMAFLRQSNRLAIFKCKTNPDIVTDNIEKEFTEGLTYEGWYREFNRIIDGASLHGTDAIEVVFDDTKPLHVSFEHIGYDRLFYNRRVGNIQDSEILLRKYELTLMRLEQFAENRFDKKQVDLILQANSTKQKRDEIVVIYKVYFKYQNVVYIAWYSEQNGVDDWLKAPDKLRLGLARQIVDNSQIDQNGLSIQSNPIWKDSDIDIYPVFLYTYREDEQEQLVEKKGRGFLDFPQQEAHTCIITGFVNGLTRASNVYAAPKTDDGESAEIKQLDIDLVHGGIYSKPLDFFHTEYPDVSVLNGLQALNTLNSQQTGKVSYAVSNRKDSRKTATELQQSQQDEQKISSTGLATLSEFLRGAFSFTWLIVRSQALQGKIKFLLIEQPIINPSTGQAIGNEFVNDIKTISETFDVRPAGDVDVIERSQKSQSMREDWPVIQTIPGVSQIFLQDYIKLRYPDRAEAYIQAMQQGDTGKNLVQSLSALLKGFVKPEEIAALKPEQHQQLITIEQEVQNYLNPQQGAQSAK